MQAKKTVLLVDGYSLLFRAFHALPLLTSKSGEYTNALHGFFAMLLKALTDYRPTGVCVMMDVHAPTFRHSMYAEYKGTRKPMPEELRPQTKLVRELLAAMNIRMLEMEGYEADDLLGSAARLANERGVGAYVLTGDRDSLQLVGSDTQVILTRKGITESLLLDEQGVLDTFGYTPAQVPDMKGLMGDSSDNIPGVAGVGEKTALKLIAEYGTLDGVLAHADEIKGKLGERLRQSKDVALLSRDLGTIRRTAPIDLNFDDCGYERMADGVPMLEKYDLNIIARSVRTLLGASASGAPDTRPTAAAARASGKSAPVATASVMQTETDLPAPIPVASERTFIEEQAIHQAASALAQGGDAPVALCEGESEISVFTDAGELWHMPILRDLTGAGLYDDQIYKALEPLFAKAPLVVHGAKALYWKLTKFSLPLPTVAHDTMLSAYLLHTAQRGYSLADSLRAEYAPDPAPEAPTAYDVYALFLRQRARLQTRNLTDLLRQMEQPLTRVLFQMERKGFLVDQGVLGELSAQFSREVESCKQAVYELTGASDFNLNSPKQLGEVLFEKLGLPAVKKNKSGGYSTDSEVLEGLAPYHPAIEPLLRYRKFSKLQSTYIEALTRMSRQSPDGRIHTTFDQTATVTGRISSLEPNLQNSPIRTDEGREIRRAFVAPSGYVLLDADYSQIELRVLAHLSGDEAMCDAFLKGQDIHTRTAAEINGVAMQDVTPAMRRGAKAVNFGVVYGISGFGLARNAGIPRKDADRFIKTYFERYPGVRAFMDECIRKGKELGYAETMFGRRRELFELASPNRAVRSFGERAAMNTPVQGTAADIIKLAMVRVEESLKAGGYKAELVLQVHDELVVECPTDEADAVAKLVADAMQNVAKLRVPLVAEVTRGTDWEEAH